MGNLHPRVKMCKRPLEYENALENYRCAMSELTEVVEFPCEHYPFQSNCQELQSCDEIILEKTLKEEKFGSSNKSVLVLDWNQPRIIYVQDFVSYDFHNFIGEVGGFLGLFWGFSFTSIFVAFEWISSKFNTR